jgi:2-polyprenyl-6-methoxyphenol hydroxylase-like FAD-dependent oxidoreductase
MAYWLRQFGFNPTVVERAGSLVTGGYKIDLRGPALDVLRRMVRTMPSSKRARGCTGRCWSIARAP